MAKYIHISDNMKDALLVEIAQKLTQARMSDGSFSFTKCFVPEVQKATVHFSEIAWLKMQSIVQNFATEVAWHGIARRSDVGNDYYIDDILVYPQEVSAANVETDDEEYRKWTMEQPDEVFNNMRMQGHSHVNMSVIPSTTDKDLYNTFLKQLQDDDFYIFMIWNKKGEKTIKIYDLAKNVLFETADCTVVIDRDDYVGLLKFMEDAKSLVKTYSYTNTKTYSAQKGSENTNKQTYSNSNASALTQKGSNSKNSTSSIPQLPSQKRFGWRKK